jgi:hypothetical protein
VLRRGEALRMELAAFVTPLSLPRVARSQ